MVQFRTVTGQAFTLDLPESTKISDVKAEVGKSQGMLVEKMVLIYQGKVLKDDTTLADNKVSETGFMVCMVPKRQPPASAPAAAPAAAANTPPAAAAPANVPADAAAPTATVTPPAAGAAAAAPAAAAGSGDAYSTGASELATGAELESKVTQICEMGFARAEVMKAMRAAFNNPERAVDYLMSGIPEDLQQQAAGSQAPASPATAAAGAAVAPTPPASQPVAGAGPNAQPLDMFPQGMPGMGGGGGAPRAAGALAFLRDNAQFQSLRMLVQANPQILQPMLQELGKQNPQLLNQINANQVEFLQMVNEPIEGGLDPEMLAQMGGFQDEEMGEGELPEGTVALTQEEADAVGRLEALGFSRHECLQAYIACDKNEESAANFLLMDD